MKHSFRNSWILWIILAVQILSVILVILIPSKQDHEPFSMELRGEDGSSLFYLVSENGSEGVSEYTREFPLKKGDYVLTAKYSCSSRDNSISVRSVSLDEEHVSLDNWWTSPDPKTDHAEIGFSLAHDVPDIKIAVCAQDQEVFIVESISIARSDDSVPAVAAKAARIVTWTFFCLLTDAFLFLLIRYPEKRKAYIVLLIASIVMLSGMIWPIGYLTSGDDLSFHINRIYGIRDGILAGIPWVKLQQNWYNGHGYPIGIFYGDALLYFPAVFNIAGIDMQSSYKIFVFLIHLLTVFSAYYCFSRMYGSKIGCYSAIFYSFLLFRMVDLYQRAAVGEFCAMAFLPFLLYAVYLLWNDNCIRSRIMFVIGFTGILQTHLITCEMAMLMVFALLIGSPRRTFTRKRILSLTGSALWVMLANLSFVIPFIDFSAACRISVMNDPMTNIAVFLYQEMDPFDNHSITYSTILVLLVLIIASVFRFRKSIPDNRDNEKTESDCDSRISFNLLLILTALFIFAGTPFFPWFQIIKIRFLTMPVASLQFVWRFLSVSGVFATALISEIFSRISDEKRNRKYARICLLSILILPGLIYSFTINTEKTCSRFSFDSSALYSKWCSLDEYLIADTDYFDVSPDYSTAGDVKITDYSKNGTAVSFTYETEKGGTIDLPLFNYPYYRADTDGGKVIPVENGNNNCIRLSLAQNSQGTVNVQFHTPLLWILSLIASIASIIVLACISRFPVKSKS